METDIPYTYRNDTDGSFFIVNCDGSTGAYLEKQVDGAWKGAWGNVVTLCLSPPVVIEPGSSVTRTLHVFGGDAGCNCEPKFAVADPTGTYRIVLTDVLSSFDANAYPFGDTIPKEYRVSNPFRLTE